MKISENNLPKFYLITLYIISGAFLYWGMIQLKVLLSKITLVLIQIFDISIYFNLILSYAFEGILLTGLAILIIKVINIKINEQEGIKSEFEISKANFKYLGFIVLVITALNILITFLTYDRFENDITSYVEKNLEKIDFKIAYMQIASGIIDIVEETLILILFFTLIFKLSDSKSNKANTS